MKTVLLSPRTGAITVADIPAPDANAGTVVIRNEWSLISAGTERATVSTGAQSLIGKARQRPDQVAQVIDSVRRTGLAETYRTVKDRLDRPVQLGYSCAGIVLRVGEGVEDIRPGMRVAAAGARYASHAEIVAVPRNLVVPVPEGVDTQWAAFATVGAIALQGIHQAEAVPGSRIAVIGLGLVGQLTLQLLRAYGYDAVGIDPDPVMVALAESAGLVAFPRGADGLAGAVLRHWAGAGADAVLITAATPSSDPVEFAGHLARDRATVVVVGDVGVAPPRSSYYRKELSIRYARSYGPGRYDPRFEEGGHPYPEGYVPWTERRNLAEVLRLTATGALDLAGLNPRVFPVEDAADAYEALRPSPGGRSVALLLRYPGTAQLPSPPTVPAGSGTWTAPQGVLRVAAIGAGNFATRTLFPELKRVPGVTFSWVAGGRGLSAAHQGQRWGFRTVAENVDSGLASGDADCVMVLSRHDSHGSYAARVLRGGTALYCEKPLGLTETELEDVADAWLHSGAPAMAGFNRRFAPAVRDLRAALPAGAPLQLVYRVFGGRLPADHWYFDPRQGGRLLGEVCHFIDMAGFLVSGKPVRVRAVGVDSRDGATAQSVTVQLTYDDGSAASIVYGGLTPPGAPKELLEIATDGVAARIDDFRSLTVWKGGRAATTAYRGGPKGHAAEMRGLVRVVRGEPLGGAAAAADFSSALWSSLVACRAVHSLTEDRVVETAPVTPALVRALGCSAPGTGAAAAVPKPGPPAGGAAATTAAF
ncbi:bi-domain-containing oxidoreductase [Streptomyces glomeratus]|uniref:Bi-domain-containing oxidoreductase n=1 Tax=Streptomyces glomeratus TaxID=284452 RepID=A0ABP6LHY1_9ACTN|nr:bi-domain-containing oxidoreductase [Streptomyces glomeratus]MCF1506627.1 bi-domain-containing oxidoreductase [Streptomyces glomeratus]